MIRHLFLYILVFVGLKVSAEQVRFEMSAPNAVEVGQQFRLTFTLNEKGVNLHPPDLSNFDVLMGPSTSQSSSFQVINGQTTSSFSFAYTYILRAKTEGTFEIRPGSIEVGGKVYESNSLKIQVVKGQPQQQQQAQGAGDGQDTSPSANVNKDDLFVRVVLNKQNVYKGEQIVATVKLYAHPNLPIQGFDEVNLPTYEGFYTQDIDMPQQINFEREVYNGRIYKVGVLKKTIIFPQQTGSITIQPFSLSCLIQQQVRARSFFDDFFSNYQTVKSKIESVPVRVTVKDLPPAPSGFYGAIGNFNIESALSETDISANDAVTLKLTISGNGNIRLVQNPKVQLPADFEIYDPKSTENIRSTESGMSGSKTIEYLFQPRFEGDYTIAPVSFSYFNPATGQYSSLSTKEFKLHVRKGTGEQSKTVVSSLTKQDVQLIGQDIRFIKQDNLKLDKKGQMFFGSTGFYLIYILSAIAFLVLVYIYRKKVRENANIALVKNRKANRVAIKRLREAAEYMKNNKDEQFYESVLKAFWGYLSDKLGIAVADLNREAAIAGLQNRGVGQEQIEGFVKIIEQCEFARYAPVGGSQARHEIYNQAELVMSDIERQIKN